MTPGAVHFQRKSSILTQAFLDSPMYVEYSKNAGIYFKDTWKYRILNEND